MLVVHAFSSVSTALLRRSLDYRSIQIAEIVGYIVGFGVIGIALAASPFARYSLVGAFVSQSILTALILYARTRHTLWLRWRSSDASAFAGFGFANPGDQRRQLVCVVAGQGADSDAHIRSRRSASTARCRT